MPRCLLPNTSGYRARLPIRRCSTVCARSFPKARIVHAFASTEAGVGFEVHDGIAGFPGGIHRQRSRAGGSEIDLKVEDGTLRIRSGRNATRYLGDASAALTSGDGFVDTGDMVELMEGRYHFRGRRGGVINVGGLQGVSRGDRVGVECRSPGANVAGPGAPQSDHRCRRRRRCGAHGREAGRATRRPGSVKRDLLNACRRSLAAHKVPAVLRLVPALELTAGGKLVRPECVESRHCNCRDRGSRGLGLAMAVTSPRSATG